MDEGFYSPKGEAPLDPACAAADSPSVSESGKAPTVVSCLPAEEEINNMKIELEKYGIQMPAFSKIGGILANELSVDEAACETAIWGVQTGSLLPLPIISTLMMTLDMRGFASKFGSAHPVLNTAMIFYAVISWK